MVKVTIQLGVQKIDNDDGVAKKKEQRSPTKKIIVNITQTPLDHDKAITNTHGGSSNSNADDDGNIKKYSMCSLLLQIGKLLDVFPSYNTISLIFDKILEQWCLYRRSCCGEKNGSRNNIYQLSDMNDGDTIELCCGDYVKDSSPENEADLLALIPIRYNTIVVSLNNNTSLETEEGTHVNDKADGTEKNCHDYQDNDNDDDDDSDIEDVTDMHVSKKRCASQEVIDVEDVSSDDDGVDCEENNNDDDKSCFWEYDKYGDLKKNANHSTKRENAKSSRHSKGDNDDDDNDDDDDDVNANSDIEIESIVRSTIDDSDDNFSDVEDVTETIMAQRKEQVQKLINNAEEICDDSDSNNSNYDCSQSKSGGAGGKKRKKKTRCRNSSQPTAKEKRRRTMKKKKMKESPIEVLIDEKDIPMRPGAKITKDNDEAQENSADDNNNNDQVDHSIKQRIVKLLNTGFHGESNEHEARNAMKLARRLIERHNLDQALLLQERGDGSLNDFSTNSNNNNNDGEHSTLLGGFVIAKVRNRKKGTALSSFPRWHAYLVSPVCMNFHVEAFKTLARASSWRKGECSVTFYGIRTNVQLAAYAFKITIERIAHMAATYEPPRNSNLPKAKQTAETRTARLSYALGIVKGLERDVKDGLQKEEERRKANLRKAQEGAKRGESYEEDCTYSDGDADHGGSSFDGVHEQGGSGKVVARDEVDHPEICQDDSSSDAVENLDKLERENTAHLALVDHHKKIASDVLKSNNIKVRAGRKHKSIKFNRKAYEKGVIDSKEVDLNQQAIEEK